MKSTCHITTFIVCSFCAGDFAKAFHKTIFILPGMIYYIRCKCLTESTLYLVETLSYICGILTLLHQKLTIDYRHILR